MKKFTKLALVSSMAISANAMAMQAMDDSALSATTGQDGINIGIGISKVEIEKLFIHDNDGLSSTANNNIIGTYVTGGTLTAPTFAAGAQVGNDRPITGGTDAAGAIVIKGNGVSGHVNENHGLVITANTAALLDSHNLLDLKIDSDAGTSATGGAFLNIAAQVSGLTINIGEIGVAASNSKPANTATNIRRGGKLDGADKNYNAILSGLTLVTGQLAANVQVGAAPQGAMIKLDTTMFGGLEIKDLGLLDSSTQTKDGSGNITRAAGEIYIGSIKVADANSKNLTLDQEISVYSTGSASANGYIQIRSKSGPIDNYISDIRLGSRAAKSIGDIEVQGLQSYDTYGRKGALITITGH